MLGDYKLSIIIPYYRTKEYTDELMDALDPQINDDVEVILVYDCDEEAYESKYEWLKIIQQPGKGLGKARNYGVEQASGEYIAFVDSDDLVTDCFAEKILNKTIIQFDICYISWKAINSDIDVRLDQFNRRPPAWNLSCWSRIYRRELVKDIKFPDGWNEDVHYLSMAETVAIDRTEIFDYMYIYRSNVEDSRTQRCGRGEEDARY